MQDKLNSESWIFYPKKILNIKEHIEQIGTPLEDLKVKIKFGIKTGYNKAFIINEKIKNKLIKKDQKSKEIIKPILRGRDINRYHISFKNLYLILSKSGVRIDKEYPEIYKHLKKFEDKLKKRWDKGKYWFNLRECSYYEEFEKPKIVWQEIVRDPNFAYDKSGFYCEATTFIMIGKNLRYIIGILNSKPGAFFFKNFYAGGGLGGSGYRYKKAFLKQLPIPKIISKNKNIKNEIEKNVENIIDITKDNDYSKNEEKQKKVKKIQEKIDRIIYELYDLSKEEIKIIEESFK